MRKSFYFISVVVLVATTLFSCAKRETPASIVPNNAAMVARFDLKSLFLKADYNFAENQLIKDLFSQLEDKQKHLKKILKNPSSSGIDLMGELYFFITTDGATGFVVPIKNSKNLYDNLLLIDETLKESISMDNGVYYANTPTISVAWDSRFLIAYLQNNLYSVSEEEQPQAVDIVSMLHRKKEESFANNSYYSRFASASGDIVSFASSKNTSKYYESLTQRLDEATLEADLMATISNAYNTIAANSLTTCSFEAGKIVIKTESLFDTPEDEARYNALNINKWSLSGNLNRYVPADNIFLFAVDLKGNGLIDDAQTLGLAKYLEYKPFESDIDIKEILSYFDGDMIVSISSLNLAANQPITFSLVASIAKDKTENANKLLASIGKNSKATKVGENSYVINNRFACIENNILYVTNDSNYYISFGKGGIENPTLDKIKGQPAYVGGNLALLKEPVMALMSQETPFYDVADYGLSMISTYETKMTGKYSSDFVINFNDTKTNSLAQIVILIDKITEELSKTLTLLPGVLNGGLR